jgi:hypothetical protein
VARKLESSTYIVGIFLQKCYERKRIEVDGVEIKGLVSISQYGGQKNESGAIRGTNVESTVRGAL